MTALALLFVAALAACAPEVRGRVAFPADTQLIVLRHADRADENLNSRGIARAQALPAALQGVHIDAIYSPGIQRNLDTAAPLAQARGLDIIRIPPTGAAQRLLAGNAGKTVVWVGNKGNITEIWAALDAPGRAPLEYGDLFFLSRDNFGNVVVARRFFGPEPD